jgi:cation diffusion facilitator family transporter
MDGTSDDPERGHGHDHEHPRAGVLAALRHLIRPHSHDHADSVDDALVTSAAGIRATKLSLVVLAVTAIGQAAVFVVSGSVALLADTIHNVSDAFTSIPLWIAFALRTRPPSRRYTYGLGRLEDLAGIVIVLFIAGSAVLAGIESVRALADPREYDNVLLVGLAGIIGFAGNEAVAIYRIRVGRRIGSAALVADGVHARTDGFTSLAVVVGAIGVMLGFPLADPLVGLLISAAIFVLLWGTVRSIGRRLMDGIEPDLLDRADHALRDTPGVLDVPRLQLRWVGHRLHGTATITVHDGTLADATAIIDDAQHRLGLALPHLDEIHIRPNATR